MLALDALRVQFGGSELFGREKDKSFESSVRTIYQVFGRKDVYPSVAEKAANLLYFVVKTTRFRMVISGLRLFCLLFFGPQPKDSVANGCLDHRDGSRRIADNALVALTLLSAESRPEDKDVMAMLVVTL